MRSKFFLAGKIYREYVQDEVTVYAAQASFFLILSFFPFVMLLLSLIQLIPALSQADLLAVFSRLLPEQLEPLVRSIVYDLYTIAPAAILSATTVATIWSASRGMLGIERGLNRITDCTRRRNYLLSRLISSIYTVILILVCILSLVLMVFGSALQALLLHQLPFLIWTAPYLNGLRALLSFGILIGFFMALYTCLPYERQKWKNQLPGAVLSTLGWFCCSYGFSIYFRHFSSYSYMYGSLAAVMILMLWLYFCICILFLGAEVNQHLHDFG